MLIATFRLEPNALALEQTLREFSALEIEAERIAAHSTAWTMPCLWAANADFDAVDEALRTDPTVNQIKAREEFADEKYYQVEWTDDVEARIDAYLDQEASVIHAHGTTDGWEVRFRFVTRDQFDTFRGHLSDQRFSFELLDLIEPGSPRQSTASLTPSQRDALVAALDHGYYDVPREVSARELAEELDTSHQALSELLRRGTAQLVDQELTTPADPGTE